MNDTTYTCYDNNTFDNDLAIVMLTNLSNFEKVIVYEILLDHRDIEDIAKEYRLSISTISEIYESAITKMNKFYKQNVYKTEPILNEVEFAYVDGIDGLTERIRVK